MRSIVCSFLLAVWATGAQAAPTTFTLDAKRVDEIASYLSPRPTGALRPVSDRAFWKTIADEPGYSKLIAAADTLKDKPIAVIPEELYLEFSRNGNRRNYEAVAFERRGRLTSLVMAECMTNQGTYLPRLNDLVNKFCEERTWVLPAHDKQLTNFNNTLVTIDLFSSDLAWQLAIADYLLGEKLEPGLRDKLRGEINRRVLQPYQDMIHHRRPLDNWLRQKNNWNAVCHNNVLGAAFHVLENPRERAELIAAAEHYSDYFLDGFTPDGYCSEGVGYWNYGYGRYSQMAVNVRHATGGKVDLFRLPGAAKPALYGPQIEVASGISPSFADCSLRAAPTPNLLWLLNRVYGWNNAKFADLPVAHTIGSLGDITTYYIARRDNAPAIPGNPLPQTGGDRTVFDEAGVFIFRPKTDDGMAVAFKGGHNGEQHNHNDVGSYLVVYKGQAPLLDPGAETYTARTFSKDRYVSRLLNSYGHAVPVVAGKLQIQGKAHGAKVIRKEFSDTTDTVVIDYTSAYDVPELARLTRTFEYGRAGKGVFVVTDSVEFKTPQTMETALVSLGEYAMAADGKNLSVTQEAARVNVHIDSSAPFNTSTETIVENAPAKPNRMAIKLNEKTSSASIRMVIAPE